VSAVPGVWIASGQPVQVPTEPDAEDFLELDTVDDATLLDDITSMIRNKYENTPRHQQRYMGPSEIGHPCPRHIALRLMDEDGCNVGGDPWPSIVGTACHTWLEQAAQEWNEHLGRERWITERRVSPREGLDGSCDLYDIDTATVLDWKVPGQSRMAHYKRHGPGAVYRAQTHLYGAGFVKSGLPVTSVGIVFMPRAGQLRGAHLWREPYDPAVAQAVFDRVDNVSVLIHDLDVEHHPENYEHIPVVPGEGCDYCPFWSPNPKNSRQCAGTTGPAALLIAG